MDFIALNIFAFEFGNVNRLFLVSLKILFISEYNNLYRELSYIGSKVEDIIDEEKGYGILVYNISDCTIHEDPQVLVSALGYR